MQATDAQVVQGLQAAGIAAVGHEGHLLYEPQGVRVNMREWKGHFGTLMPFLKCALASPVRQVLRDGVGSAPELVSAACGCWGLGACLPMLGQDSIAQTCHEAPQLCSILFFRSRPDQFCTATELQKLRKVSCVLC